jgi:hypothetical protein
MLAAAERGARVEPGEFGPVRRALAAVREAAAGDVEARAAALDASRRDQPGAACRRRVRRQEETMDIAIGLAQTVPAFE